MIETRLSDLDGGKLLDVATGRGDFLEYLIATLKSYSEAYGIDSSEEHISVARHNLGNDKIDFEVMDAGAMTFDSNSFDIVAVSNALHHMESVEPVLQEMKRVLKPDGIFIINEMFRDFQNEKQSVFVRAHNWWAAIDRIKGVVHNQTYRKEELLGFADWLGLQGIEMIENRDILMSSGDSPDEGWLIDKIDDYIRRIASDAQHADLLEQGKQIRRDVTSTGFAKPTELFILGHKAV
ncbi:MAG: class I SAM-dependent methyltransferase [Candidatus Zixiibacteriota bacterium]